MSKIAHGLAMSNSSSAAASDVAGSFSRFISGAESMDSWDKYVEQINKMDLAGYTDLVQAALDRYNAL